LQDDHTNIAATEPISLTVNIPDIKPQKYEFLKTNSISDVRLVLEVSQETRHHTSYDLVFEGKPLQDEVLLADLVSNSNQKTLSLSLKLAPYAEKSIHTHLVHVRNIAGLNSKQSFGINAGVCKLAELQLQPPTEPRPEAEDQETSEGEKSPKQKKINIPERTFEEKAKINEIISGFFDKLPQGYYTPTQVITPALRALYLGPYNPVPLNYKAKGHLAYIVVQTSEGDIFHITASTTGFYVNKSSNNKFDPAPRDPPAQAFTLYELISKVSKGFLSIIKSNIEKSRSLDTAVTAEAENSFLSNPWITKPLAPTADFGREQFEDKSFKDFNHDYQSLRDLPDGDYQDRLLKEKLLIKTAYEFTVEATKTALGVLNGAFTPMNPEDTEETHIFLHNGIFYSHGVDIGSFSDKGGNSASRASVNQDLQAVKFINTFSPKGIYTLMTTIVDYAGKRVVCQTPVPGLFTSTETKEVKNEETGEVEVVQGEPLTSVAYGFDDATGKTETDPEFVDALGGIAKALHFKRKDVDSVGSIVTNPEIKGMRGSDKRKYILDLYNATPYDIEFIEKHFNPESETSYPHKQAVIRMEAVQDWWTTKAKELIDEEAKSKGIDLSVKLKEGEQPPTVTVDQEKLLFSVDAFSGENTEDANVRDLSKHITSVLVPRFLSQYDQIGAVAPIEGSALSSQMHKSGINVRYLGFIASQLEKSIIESLQTEKETLEKNVEHNKDHAAKVKERDDKILAEITAKNEAEKKGEKYDLKEIPDVEYEDIEIPSIAASKQYQYILDTVILEMVARSSKHILRHYSAGLPLALVSSLVAHYHNVLLGSAFNASPKAVMEGSELYTNADLSFAKLTPESVKKAIARDVKIHYRYDLPSDWTERFSSKQLLREIAVKFGIQWNQREYFFSQEQYEAAEKAAQADKKAAKQKVKGVVIPFRTEVFEPKDISFAPIIKDTIPRSATAEQFFDAGRMTAQEEDEAKKQSGFDLIKESITIYEQVYGELNPEVQRIYASLSHLFQESNKKVESVLAARKAAYIAERVYGLDSHETFVALLNLAYLELECGSVENSMKVYGKLSQLWYDVYDNKHVSITAFFTHPIFSLQEQGYSKEATHLVRALIDLSNGIHGEKSYSTATLKYRLAFLYAVQEKFNDCISTVKAAYNDLVDIASEKNVMTRQAAVLLQRISAWKEVNELSAKNKEAAEKLQKAEESKKEAAATKKKSKNAGNLDDMSIDELLNFIENKSNKKKGKK
jgi:protein TIF31